MKLLALHGGGMLGYMCLCYLEKLEEESGKPVTELFDFIGGVSTGSLIAAGYAAGKTTKELREMYESMHGNIFGDKRNLLMSLFYPMYDIDNLERACKECFGEKRICDSDVKTMIHAVQVTNTDHFNTVFWKSWKDDEYLYKIACASSAAPAAFSPYKIGDSYFTDGGVATNNPTMCMVTEAVKMGANPEDIEVVSMWTEEYPALSSHKKIIGLIKVVFNISGLFTKSGEDVVDHQAEKLVKKLIAVKPDASLSIDTDEYEVMKQAALSEWSTSGEELLSLFK